MPTKQKLLLCAKNSYKETSELGMKTAADEVSNLVISEKNDTVNENDSAANRNANIDADDSHSDENLLLTPLFRVTAHGKRGGTIL